MIKKIIRRVINILGYELIPKKKYQNFPDSEMRDEVDSIIQSVRKNTMVTYEGLETLYRQVLYCEKNRIEGDFVECGVWKGGAVGVMAKTNLLHGLARRNIHLFDSFEEICEPDAAVDGKRALDEVKKYSKRAGTSGRLVPLKGVYDRKGGPGTIKENKKLLIDTIGYNPDFIFFHKGWFQDTLPHIHHNIDNIALLRLDSDWYASTKISLEYLFDKVVVGGFVIIDDYGAYEGCRKAVDEFFRKKQQPYYLHNVNDEIRYVQKL